MATALLALNTFCATAAELQVAVHNVPATAGRIYIALFDGAAAMEANQPTASKVIDVKGSTMVVSFGGLAEGRYAFNVFADENANGKLDTNFVGMPTEPYGFSNDAMGWMGPPSFEAAAVTLGKEKAAIAIRLR